MKKNEQLTPERNAKFRLTIEPAGFLLVTAGVIQGIVHQNSYLNKFCRVNFQLNVSSCDLRNTSDDTHKSEHDDEMAQISDRIQSSVSSLLMWASLIETLPSILFVLFLGPWSNEHGRKPLMILPVTGYTLSIMVYMLVIYADSLTAEYLLFASLPIGMTGGFNTLIMATHSYLADISTEDSRTSRLSIFSGMITISVPVANFVSVHIYNSGGEWAVWYTSLGLTASALFYVIFFVTESRSPKPQESKEYLEKKEASSFVKSHCSPHLASLSHCFVVTFRPREGHNRARLGLMIIMSCLSSFSFAPSTMAYLFVRKKFAWDAPDFAMYGVVVSIVPIFGTLLILPLLSSYFKIHDWIIGMVSLLGNIISSFIFAFASNSLMLYLSSLGTLLTVGIGVVINSTISKIVETEEIGYVYSVTACVSSIVPLISSAAVKLIYMATLDFFPGFVFIFGAVLDSIMVLLLITEFVLQKKENVKGLAVDQVIGISFKYRDSFRNETKEISG